MARSTHFDEYRERYPDYALDLTDDGILTVRMHRDGGPIVWDQRSHHDIGDLFADIAGDRAVRVVIYTGTGEYFNHSWGRRRGKLPASYPMTPAAAEEYGWDGRQRHENMLSIEAIMIAAVNGPVNIHSELALMCDIVLATDDTYFQDAAHFPRNIVPGDGVQNIWPLIIGFNRFRYWQLTGQKISAQQALEWGAVNEVLPRDDLMPRARELAEYLLRFSPLALRHTRRVFVQEFKRAAVNNLALGQTLELMGLTEFTATGGGMAPLDRPWDDPDLFADD